MHKATKIFLHIALIAGFVFGTISQNSGLYAQKGKKNKKNKSQNNSSVKTGPGDQSKIDFFFIEASTEYVKGNKSEALELYKQVLEIDGDHHASIYNIAKIYFEEGKHSEAERYGKMALDANADNYWYYKLLADIYDARRDIKQAIRIQERLVEKFPEDVDAMFDLAQFYITDDNYNRSVEVYDQIETQIGMNEDVVFRKHQLYQFLNQPDKALAELEKLIAFFPNDPRYYQARYDVLMMADREEEAIKTLENLLQANPNDAFALLALADYYKSKGEFKKSDEFLFRAFDNEQVELEAKVEILSALYPYADRDPAVRERMEELGARLYNSHPKSALVNGVRADIFQANGNSDSARHYYRRSLEIDPSNQKVWQELLFIDSEANDFKALEKDAEEALEYFPNQTLFLYFFGLGSSQNEHFEEAIYAFEKIKSFANLGVKGEVDELILQTHITLGDIYNEVEDYKKSDENFEAALKLDDDNPTVLNNYAYFLSLRNEKLDEAEVMVKKAIELAPNQSAYQDTYGWILFMKGEFSDAEKWIRKAISNGGEGEVYEHLGDVLFKQGKTEAARSSWEKANETGSKVDIEAKLKAAGN